MNAREFGAYLRGLRKSKKMTIRQLELYAGVSNAYLSHVENGKRGIPSPDVLRKLSGPLGVAYEELMEKAGYIDPNEKESAHALPESEFDRIVTEVEEEQNVNLRDNPIAHEAVRNALDLIAKALKSSERKR